MDDSNNLENRQGLLEQSHCYTVYLPLFSSGIALFYLGVYLLRYYCWRIKQRRQKIRLLEYEKLRWLWHQKQSLLLYQAKEEKNDIDIDDEQDCTNVEKYPYSRPSSSASSLSVTTVNDNKNEYETKLKAKQNQRQQQQQQKKCDYGDDSSHCRESNLVLTIPSPAYQPSHNHITPKTRLSNHKTQLHHHHYLEHQHQNSLSSSSAASSSSSTRNTSSQSHHHHHQASYCSSSSSTTTLTCSCSQQHRYKKEHTNSGTSPCLTASPTTLSFSNPTSPSSSLKEAPDFFYCNQKKEKETTHHTVNRSHTHSFISRYDNNNNNNISCPSETNPTSNVTVDPYIPPKSTKSQCSQQTYWSFYDSKAKRTRMMWKWSVAMGYCHYDHAKRITSIIDQWDPPPSRGIC